MKKESNLKYILRLTLTLLLITAFVAAALAGVNAITKDKIAAIQLEKANQAMNEVLPGYEGFEACPFTGSASVKNVYLPQGGDGSAFVVEVAPVGFGGEILMMVGVDGGKVTGVSIVSQTETAGLGAIVADKTEKGEAFRGQFAGQEGTVQVDKDGGQIQAITGATITSRAVAQGVTDALAVQIVK